MKMTLLSIEQKRISRRIYGLKRRLLKYPNDKKAKDALAALNRKLYEVNSQMGRISLFRRIKKNR